MKYIFLLFAIAFCFSSCERRGDWEKIYPQGFSATELSFSAKGGNTTITSQRDEWYFFGGIEINGEYFYFPRCGEVFPYVDYSHLKEPKPGICSDNLLTVKYDILKKYLEIVEIESAWFKITKEDPKQMTVFIEPNLTGETRQIGLLAIDRNGTRISITQLTE